MHVKDAHVSKFSVCAKITCSWDQQPSEIRVEVGVFKVQNVKNLQIAQLSQAKIANNNKNNKRKQTMS